MVLDMELESSKARVLELMNKKDQLELELQELKQILNKNNIGMTEALVDSEGYPRSDIDVYQVRHARHKIICLQNDYKALMKEIEKGLIEVHSITGNKSSEPSPAPSRSIVHPSDIIAASDVLGEPFLKVTCVSQDSPAETAGLRTNDLIMGFGSISSQNFKSLQDIGDLVAHSRNKSLIVHVKRSDDDCIVLTLIPKPWKGKGLLGCNVIPIENVER